MCDTDVLILVFLGTYVLTAVAGLDVELEPGHLKPFGTSRPSYPVEEIHAFPKPKEFFENYVRPMKPLLIKDVAWIHRGFELWTDEYFMEVDGSSEYLVTSEPFQKQLLNQPVKYVPFSEFVSTYNGSGHYMVNSIPPFLRKDLTVPCSIQCPLLVNDNLVENVMWFSSGGTNGSVHIDATENMLCMFRGQKLFTMIDPAKHGHEAFIDAGAYSEMDPDSVDFRKYPGMAEVEFWHANVTAGDCVFVPYKWIHQVRSTGSSNLGLSIWWRHYLTDDLDYATCNSECDPEMTFDLFTFHGFGDVSDNPLEVRDQFLTFLGAKSSIGEQEFLDSYIGAHARFREELGTDEDARQMFQQLDQDGNGLVTAEEINSFPSERYVQFGEILEVFEEDLNSLLKQEVQRSMQNAAGTHTEL